MGRIHTFSGLLFAVAGLGVACSGADDGAAAVATPSLVMGDAAAIGSPVEMTYRFAVADDAPTFGEDYKVPKFPYVGLTRVEVGLFSPTTGDRLPLNGDTIGQRSYQVATFDLRLPSENLLVVYAGGWHNAETANPFEGPEWHWSMRDATLSFSNPQRDIRFYLQLDQPAAAFTEPQQVELRAGSEIVDRFPLPAAQMELRRVDIPASALGTAGTVDLTISVDQTFVPASVPALSSGDSRELGVRVFQAFVQPS
jgi:hypothetical protein